MYDHFIHAKTTRKRIRRNCFGNQRHFVSRHFGSDGDLRGNEWETSKHGEDYQKRLRASKRPDVLKFISTVLAPRVEAVDREFAQKYGLKTDPQLENTLRTLHTQNPSQGTQGVAQYNSGGRVGYADGSTDRKSTRLNSSHT